MSDDDLDLSPAAINARYRRRQWDAEPRSDEHDPVAWAAAIKLERYSPTDFGV